MESLELAGDHAAGGAVERDPVALLEGAALDAQFLLGFVDDAVAGAGHAALPMPRVTTTACEVMPPREVRMPDATSMPAMSSGVVSPRTRMMTL